MAAEQAAADPLGADQRRGAALARYGQDAIFDVSAEGTVQSWNPAAERIFGHSEADIIGRSVDELVPDGGDGLAGRVAALVATSGRGVDTLAFVDDADQPRLVELRAVPLEGDGPATATVVGRDVTLETQTAAELAASEALYRRVLNTAPLGIGMRDPEQRLTFANSRLGELLGLPVERLIGFDHEALHDSQDWPAIRPLFQETTRNTDQQELPIRRWDGSDLWVLKETTAMWAPDGTYTGTLFTLTDVTERKRAEALLEDQEKGFRGYFQHAAVGVGRIGLDGQLDEANPALGRMLGFRTEEVVGRNLLDLVDPSQRRTTRALLLRFARRQVSWTEMDRRFLHRDGHVVHLHFSISAVPGDDGRPRYLAAVCQDISARKAVEEELARRALHDPLTGLANRALLRDRIARGLSRVGREGGMAALLFLDLDQFKLVNDSLGHGIGDELLQAVATRLVGSIRPGDSVARLGGDEFVVLCEGLQDLHDVRQLAERVLEGLGAPFVVAGRQLFATASIGVATTPAVDADSLLRDADAAMYQAKELGRNRYALFVPSLHHRTSRQLRLASELHDALGREQLMLQYQPIVNLVTEAVIGFEALVRWQHPDEGLLPPDEFITVAEDIGLIPVVGAWVVREACLQAATWQDLQPGLSIHVNVSPHQLSDTFVGQVVNALASSGLPADRLVLEVTEQAVMTNFDRSSEVLGALQELGIRIAIDDFGTGYSSLAYLQNLPVDELKVDQTFIQRLGDTDADAAIVSSIINLAHTFGLTAVAEGVETVRQAELVSVLGCDEAQGHIWSTPVAAGEVASLLRRRRLSATGAGAAGAGVAPTNGRVPAR